MRASDEQRLRKLVQSGLDHGSAGTSSYPPILTVWGTRGSELSALLERTAQEWSTRVPLAHVRGEEFSHDRILPILLRLTELLGQDVRGFGRLLFPRFVLGFVATRGPLDTDLAPLRREEMIRRALAGRSNIQRWVVRTANALAGLADAPPSLIEFLGMVAGDVFAAAQKAAALRGAALSWYKTGLDGPPKNLGIDGLVELARFADDDELVESVLCRAFLEDLRAGYAFTIRRLYARNKNCLVIIDQAGAASPRKFLDIVSVDRHHDRWDPLLVVAASTLRHTTVDVPDAIRWRSRPLRDASLDDWRNHRDECPGWQHRYPLHWQPAIDVSPLEAPAPAAVHPPFDDFLPPVLDQMTRRVVTTVRRLTAQHPAGVALVLHALGLAHQATHEPVDLRSVLFSPAYDTRESLDDRIVGLLLGDQWADIPRSVVRMALLRDLGPTQLAPVIGHADGEDPGMIWDFVERDVWIHIPDAGTPETAPVMHPLVRRAVAHRLARQPLCNLEAYSGRAYGSASPQLRRGGA